MFRFVLGVATLATAIAVAVAGVLIVLPPFGGADWMVRTVVTEFSLMLLLPILLVLVLAWFSSWTGIRRVGVVSAILAGLAVPLALLPAVRGGIEAHERGIALDALEYVSGTGLDTAIRSDETVTYGPAARDQPPDPDRDRPEGIPPSGRTDQPPDEDREMTVWRPAQHTNGRLPAVINVHDGSGFDRWNRWFTERDMLAFDLVTEDAGDVVCASSWLSSHAHELGVDPDRIVLFGTGAGGRLAMLAAYAEDAVGSSCAGARPRSEPSPAAVMALYPPSEQADRAGEPFRYVDPGDPPSLLAHGGRDPMTPITESRRTVGELEVAGVPARLVGVGYAGHGFDLNWGGFAAQITRAEIDSFLHTL